MLDTSGGRSVPLAQIATLSYALEPPLIWRRQRLPTVTVQADVAPGIEATTVVKQLEPAIAAFRAQAAGRLRRRRRRHHRGQRQGAGQHLRRSSRSCCC